MRKVVKLLGVAALLVALVCAGCGGKAVAPTLRLTGTLDAPELTVKSPRAGRVLGLIVSPGERISQGQPLFALEDKEADAVVQQRATELARAEAELKAAKDGGASPNAAAAEAYLGAAEEELAAAQQDYEKLSRLYAIGGISRVRYETARQRFESAQASAQAARGQAAAVSEPVTPERLQAMEEKVRKAQAAYEGALLAQGEREMTAPCTCTVVQVLLRSGDMVTEGQPVLVLRPLTRATVTATLPAEAPEALLRAGTAAALTAGTHHFTGHVERTEGHKAYIRCQDKPEVLADGTPVEITLTGAEK